MFRLRFTTEAQPRSKNGHPAQSTTGVASRNCIQVESRGEHEVVQAERRDMAAHLQHERPASVSASPIQNRRVMSTSSGFGPASAVTVQRLQRHAADRAAARPLLPDLAGASGRCRWCPSRWRLGRRGAFGCEILPGSASNFVRHPAEQKWKVRPPCSMRCLEVAGSTFMPQTGSVTRLAAAIGRVAAVAMLVLAMAVVVFVPVASVLAAHAVSPPFRPATPQARRFIGPPNVGVPTTGRSSGAGFGRCLLPPLEPPTEGSLMSGSPGAGGTREGGRLRGAPDVAGFAGVAGAGALQVAQRRPAGPAFNRGSRRLGSTRCLANRGRYTFRAPALARQPEVAP